MIAAKPEYDRYTAIWIGVRYSSSKNIGLYADGTNYTSANYGAWAPGQPNDAGETKFCAVSTKADAYLWRLEDCNINDQYYGLCYEPPDPTSTSTTTTTTTRPVATRPPRVTVKPRTAPNEMTHAEFVAAVVVQSMGCTFIIAALAATIGKMLTRSF